jgi:hypothetical protein
MKTNQELFDLCIGHVLKQGEPASAGNSCFYQTPSGRGCAIGGPMAAEGHYNSVIEGLGIETLMDRLRESRTPYAYAPLTDKHVTLIELLTAFGVDEDQFPLLSSIQSCHDQSAHLDTDPARFITYFKERAHQTANRFGLNKSILS